MADTSTKPSTATQQSDAVIKQCLQTISAELHSVLTHEKVYLEDIETLRKDLGVYKASCDTFYREKIAANAERDAMKLQLDECKVEMEKLAAEVQQMRNKPQLPEPNRVTCVIDGDGTLFTPLLLSQGRSGATEAAKTLFDAVRDLVDGREADISVYVFYNRKGLTDAMSACGLSEAHDGFDDFVVGFNQSCLRFLMVDVGCGKEEADAKLRVYLEDCIRLPQTLKVVFGGCHDNGYVNVLRSYVTEGLGEKLVLLPGFQDMATGFGPLGLPVLLIPNLFMPDKMVVKDKPFIPHKIARRFTVSRADSLPTGEEPNEINGIVAPSFKHKPAFRNGTGLASAPATPAYSYTPIAPPDADDGFVSVELRRPVPRPPPSRPVTAGLKLTQHVPPPCTFHHLATCPYRHCNFAHDYDLKKNHFKEMREGAKRTPCPFANKSLVCPLGEKCPYAHKCPQLGKCTWLKQGKPCKFHGADMHKAQIL